MRRPACCRSHRWMQSTPSRASMPQAGVLGTYPHDARLPEYRERIGRFIGARGTRHRAAAKYERCRCNDRRRSRLATGRRSAAQRQRVSRRMRFPGLRLRRRGVNVRLVESARERLTPDVLRRHDLGAHASRRRLVGSLCRRLSSRSRRVSRPSRTRRARFSASTRCRGWAFSRSTSTAVDADAIFAGGPKWMLALHGIAILYLAPRLAQRLQTCAARLALGGEHLGFPQLRTTAFARRLTV